MTLTLTIENMDTLPDGGPLSVILTGRRGMDIGRDQYLDWTLPDPDRVISGKHAEIRHRDGGYWLQDVSRNGTFLNRDPQRLQQAYRLRDGDRIEIGRYVIRVAIAGEELPATTGPEAPAGLRDYWDTPGEAPPIPSRDLRPPSAMRPVQPDFVDWTVDLPAPTRPAAVDLGMEWANATPDPLPPPRPPLPTPRRPPSAEPGPSPYGEGAPASAHPFAFPASEPIANPWGAAEQRIAAPSPPLGDEAPSGGTVPSPEKRGPGADVFMERFAAGLGIAPDVLSWQDPGDLAEEAGVLLRLCAESLKQLLAGRADSKRAAKTVNQTTVQALDNNPLKFAPTVDDALRIMLGRPSSGYLEARRAMDAGFQDLKTHQVKTYAAMQNALRLLLDEVSPEGIAASDEKDRGLGGLLGSRKARLWDLYATRWNALSSPHEDGMVDAFMIFFADCYDRNR